MTLWGPITFKLAQQIFYTWWTWSIGTTVIPESKLQANCIRKAWRAPDTAHAHVTGLTCFAQQP